MRIKLFLIVIGGLLYCCSPKKKLTKDHPIKKISSEILIKTLDSLGYFNMTPLGELDSLKHALKQNFSHLNYFEGKQFYDSIKYVDFRYYWLDGEELYEDEGLLNYLKEIKPTFDKLGLKFQYENENVLIKKDNFVHTIVLNKEKYIISNGVFDDLSWKKTAFNFAKMLNTDLKKQGSRERVYLIFSDNDGRIVFLSKEMYAFITQVFPKDHERPLEINEWAKENGI